MCLIMVVGNVKRIKIKLMNKYSISKKTSKHTMKFTELCKLY